MFTSIQGENQLGASFPWRLIVKKKKKLLIIWKSYYENRICSDLMGSPKLSNCIPSSLCCLGTIQKQGDCEWPDISKAAFLLILVIVLMFI